MLLVKSLSLFAEVVFVRFWCISVCLVIILTHLYPLVIFFVNLFAVTKDMELKPNCGSERAWVWTVAADYADEEPQKETLAIRFANAES